MALIVAARFQTFDQAGVAAKELFEEGFLDEDIFTFYVNPAGEHDRYPIGGDRTSDPDSAGGQYGAMVGGAVSGLVLALVVAFITSSLHESVVAVVAAAGVGAYIGALVGALWMLGRRRRFSRSGVPMTKEGHPELRQAGVVLALHCTPAQERIACCILRENGGKDVEWANGRWAQGEWIDFDPLVPPQREPEPTQRDKASMPSSKAIRGT